jgi:hypothetical protein
MFSTFCLDPELGKLLNTEADLVKTRKIGSKNMIAFFVKNNRTQNPGIP